jgi:uncharacterized protein (DUF305 family)
MRWFSWRILPGLLLVLPLIVAACGGNDDDADGNGAASPATATRSSATTVTATTEGMSGHDMGSPTGDADADLLFLDGMVVHHQSAVAMAEIAQEVSERPEIQDLAADIIEAQNQEIEQLQQWRAEWYPEAPESDLTGMADMPGMSMSDADMEMLREAEDFDQMFIEMMIPHHEAAIAMAEELQETTERPELEQLTEDIITAQQAEIEQMRQWQAEWFGE